MKPTAEHIIFDTVSDPAVIQRYRAQSIILKESPGISPNVRRAFDAIYEHAIERVLNADMSFDKVSTADRMNPNGPKIVRVANFGMLSKWPYKAAQEAWRLADKVVNTSPGS